jgi:hypothetical protein
MVMPSTVTSDRHVAAGPYLRQSLLLAHSVQQMRLPPLFRPQNITGEFGHPRLLAQASEHQPGPEPPFTQRPDVHSALVVQWSPSGKATQSLDGLQTRNPALSA